MDVRKGPFLFRVALHAAIWERCVLQVCIIAERAPSHIYWAALAASSLDVRRRKILFIRISISLIDS